MVQSTASKYQSLAGLIVLTVPIMMISYWIYISSNFDSHQEGVQAYLEVFPNFLQSGLSSTLFSMTFCALAVVLGTRSLTSAVGLWRWLNRFIMITGVGLFLLNGWSLL